MKRAVLRVFVSLSLAGVLPMVGCGNPCVSLSERICRCEADDNAQTACIQRVGALNDSQGTTAEETQRCEEILASKQCTCAALSAGRLDLCGLADTENLPPLEE